ncbi:MAG: cytochrome c biogenesis protein ResB [Deltaproteobacteria bacterium]|nr:cytochrome c biogenesis protein ResB [Deltaproteobacteria bacterium]
MQTNNKPKPSKNPLWLLFTSVKFTVTVLLLLAITSAAGTIIPQNGSPENYIQAYGKFGFTLIQVLDLFNMYHSWWFRTLIGLLIINIIICTIHRWPTTWKLVVSTGFKPESLSRKKPMQEFTTKGTEGNLESLYTSFMKKQYQVKVDTIKDGFRIYGEKGRWSRLGVPIVHFSVVLILAGALVGSFFGFDGYVNIPEGGSADRIQLRDSDRTKALGFEVVCKDFSISYYDSGAVKEYRSALQLKEDGKIILEKDIIVNDPLRYKGINFFQSSYGSLPPENLELKIMSRDSKKIQKYKTKIGKTIELPGNAGQFLIKKFNRDFHFRNVELGQAIEGELFLTNAKPVNIALPFRFPTFDKMRKGQWVITIESHDNRYYTGLQVTRDPGVFLVYLGFILILTGCWVVFFSSHKKILVEVTSSSKNSQVKIFGATTRNKMDFGQQIEKLAGSMKQL